MAPWDIMFSYNWNTGGAIADKLEPILLKEGYKIWRDKAEMGKNNNMNMSMAEGVNGSEIILLFISQKYEESDACQKEFNYADKCKKITIPLKVESYYPKQGGALDLLTANVKYYPLYRDFDANVKDLLTDIANKLKKSEPTVEEEPPVAETAVIKTIHIVGKTTGQQTMGKHGAIKIEPSDLMMYLVDKKFNADGTIQKGGRKFSQKLLEDEEEMVGTIFTDAQKSDYPILESICYLKYDLGYDDPDDLTEMVTKALQDSENNGYVSVYTVDLLNKILKSLEAEHKLIDFTDGKRRNEVYERLAKVLNKEARLFAHFLLPYDKVQHIFLDNHNVEDRLLQTFKTWDRSTDPELRTWTSIRQILLILKKNGHIKKIEKALCQVVTYLKRNINIEAMTSAIFASQYYVYTK